MSNFDFSRINGIIAKTNIDDVNAESTERAPKLPDGVYLCSVSEAVFETSKTSGNDQLKMVLKTVEDGTTVESDPYGQPQKAIATKTANRIIYKYYPITNEDQYRRMCSDLCKFEDPTNPGVPFVQKEDMSQDGEYLDLAVQGIAAGEFRIYVQLTTRLNRGVPASEPMTSENSSQWPTLLSWHKAKAMGFDLDD